MRIVTQFDTTVELKKEIWSILIDDGIKGQRELFLGSLDAVYGDARPKLRAAIQETLSEPDKRYKAKQQ